MSLIPYAFDGAAQTMSSQEIAELTGKQHKDVRRDIQNMEQELSRTFAQKSEPSTGGRPSVIYLLPKRETLILVSGYSMTMRAKIIDRWQELEAAQRPDPMVALNDPATMRALLLGYTEKVIALEGRVSELQPKAVALDRIANTDGSLCLMDTAKTLQVRPKDLIAWMKAHLWIFMRVGTSHWVGRAEKLNAGYLEHKVTTIHRTDGTERITTQVRVTPKGLAKLAEAFPVQGEIVP